MFPLCSHTFAEDAGCLDLTVGDIPVFSEQFVLAGHKIITVFSIKVDSPRGDLPCADEELLRIGGFLDKREEP